MIENEPEVIFEIDSNHMPIDSKMSFSRVRTVFFFSMIIGLSLAMLYLFRPFFYPMFWAAVIAVMFYRLYSRLVLYIKMPSASALITILLVIVILILPLVLISTLLVRESIHLYQTVSETGYLTDVEKISSQLEGTFLEPFLETFKTEWTIYARDISKKLSVFLFNSLKDITQVTLQFFLMLFLMFYSLFFFLKDGPNMLRRITHLSPLGDQYEKMLFDRFTSTARATLKSTLIVGGIQGTLGGLLFWATGVEGAFVWGVVMVALSLIPAVGSSLVWFPTGIVMLALGNVWQGITILAVGVLVISTIDNMLRPPLVGKDIQMHPMLVLFSTLGGIFLFGISGFVIGPILSALYLSVISIYDHYYRNELTNN